MNLKYGVFIYDQESGQMRLAVTLELDKDGQITATTTPGHEGMRESVLSHARITAGGKKRVTATSDPLKWIQALPSNFNGTYCSAGKLPDEVE